MKNRLNELLAVAGATALLIQTTGCSVIGLGIGSMIDNHKPHGTYEAWPREGVRPGADVVLALEDGSQLEGEYVRMDSVAVEDSMAGAGPQQAGQAFAPAVVVSHKVVETDPLRNRVSRKAVETRVPLDRLVQVEVMAPMGGRTVGGLVGLGLDVAVVVAAIAISAAMSGPWFSLGQ